MVDKLFMVNDNIWIRVSSDKIVYAVRKRLSRGNSVEVYVEIIHPVDCVGWQCIGGLVSITIRRIRYEFTSKLFRQMVVEESIGLGIDASLKAVPRLLNHIWDLISSMGS